MNTLEVESGHGLSLDDLLRTFIGGDDLGYDTVMPFVQFGWKYFCDGRCIVRKPTDEPETKREREPKAHSLSWPSPASATVPWPKGDYSFVMDVIGEDEDGDEIRAFITKPNVMKLGNRAIATKYHAMISLLPNVRCRPDGGELEPIFFVFDGGQGMLMPVQPGIDK